MVTTIDDQAYELVCVVMSSDNDGYPVELMRTRSQANALRIKIAGQRAGKDVIVFVEEKPF